MNIVKDRPKNSLDAESQDVTDVDEPEDSDEVGLREQASVRFRTAWTATTTWSRARKRAFTHRSKKIFTSNVTRTILSIMAFLLSAAFVLGAGLAVLLLIAYAVMAAWMINPIFAIFVGIVLFYLYGTAAQVHLLAVTR